MQASSDISAVSSMAVLSDMELVSLFTSFDSSASVTAQPTVRTIVSSAANQTKGRSGSWSTNEQKSGRELLTPDEVRLLDNRYAILFIRGAQPVIDLKFDLMRHRSIRFSSLGGAAPYLHRCGRSLDFGMPLFTELSEDISFEKEKTVHESFVQQ